MHTWTNLQLLTTDWIKDEWYFVSTRYCRVNSCPTASTHYEFYQYKNNIDFFYLEKLKLLLFALHLVIFILRVSTLAFVLLYELVFKRPRPVIFPWSKSFPTKHDLHLIKKVFSSSNYFPLIREVSTKLRFFHKKWLLLDQEGFSKA